MSEPSEVSTTIAASPSSIMAVLVDYESYPQWQPIVSASVLQRDEQGRATEVAYEVKPPVIGGAKYTLSYTYAPGDVGCSWTTKEFEGSITDIRGDYVLEPADGETKVTTRVSTQLAMKIPDFLKKQGEKRELKKLLAELKKRAESS